MMKIKNLALVSLLTIFYLYSNAQKHYEFNHVDLIMSRTPDSLTFSTRDIAEYINSYFHTQKEKARAAFYWIAENIAYDYENMFVLNVDQDTVDATTKILKSRKGICHDYSKLYFQISSEVGIKTFVIDGYTKKDGMLSMNPHAWCASMIDSAWYFFDPTWSAGYMENSTFIKKFDNSFYMIKPDVFIKTHMPYDPLWQLLHHPITYQEFESKSKRNRKQKGTNYFNYNDTINKIEKLTKMDNLVSKFNRIKNLHITNYLIYDYLFHINLTINNYYETLGEQQYSTAVNSYNEGIYLLNKYTNYRNKYYMPYKSDIEIERMLDDIKATFGLAITKLKQLENSSPRINDLSHQLYKLLELELENIAKEKENLNEYLKTAKKYRESLSQSNQ